MVLCAVPLQYAISMRSAFTRARTSAATSATCSRNESGATARKVSGDKASVLVKEVSAICVVIRFRLVESSRQSVYLFAMHANRIREFRQKRGIGMTELAYRIGRSVGALQQYEVGAVPPPLPVARQIASVLTSSLDEVFPEGMGRSDDPNPDPIAA